MSKFKPALAVHGGAGSYKQGMTPEREKAFHVALNEALIKGQKIIESGGPSLDAVEEAVRCLEDCPLFNAGKGSVYSHDGTIEMDAAIMNGKDLSAGSVLFVKTIRNPISAARAVMEKTEHVMLVGPGAETFAKEVNLEIVDPSYFHTDYRWESFQKIKNKDKTELNLGTVGAVAIDQFGNLAAATSTGGMNNKKFGRVGDSGIIGAGVYANNQTCAISCTGHGEYFLRSLAAYDISALMQYKGLDLESACHEVMKEKIHDIGGEGGIIAIDKTGQITLTFSTDTMFRGFVRSGEEPQTFIFDTHSKIT